MWEMETNLIGCVLCGWVFVFFFIWRKTCASWKFGWVCFLLIYSSFLFGGPHVIRRALVGRESLTEQSGGEAFQLRAKELFWDIDICYLRVKSWHIYQSSCMFDICVSKLVFPVMDFKWICISLERLCTRVQYRILWKERPLIGLQTNTLF